MTTNYTPTIPDSYDPFAVTESTSITGIRCRCPNCGYTHGSNETSVTLYIPAHGHASSAVLELLDEPPLLSLKELHRLRSKQDVQEAQRAIRSGQRQPRAPVSLQSQKRPHVRPVSKKRVCAGSSRYRVLVN